MTPLYSAVAGRVLERARTEKGGALGLLRTVAPGAGEVGPRQRVFLR